MDRNPPKIKVRNWTQKRPSCVERISIFLPDISIGFILDSKIFGN
jgi:hypothetical protein